MKSSLFVLALALMLFCFSCKQDKNNTPPVINSIELDSTAISLGGTIKVHVLATDPDGDALNYSYTVSKGSIVGFGANVQIIAPMESGIYNLNIVVSDGKGGEATGYEVFYVNSKPIINEITILPEMIRINSTATIEVDAIDPDGDQLIYKYLPDVGIIVGSGSSVTWNAPDFPGSFNIEISVSDSKDTVKADRTLTVIINAVPIISYVTVNPASVAAGGTATVTVIATDSDNDPLTYTYTPNGGAISGSGASVTWTAPSIAGAYSCSVLVSDGNGGTAIGSGNLTVTGGGGGNTTIAGTAFFIAGTSGDLSNSKVSIYTSLDNWNFNIPIKFVGCSGSGSSVTFSMTNVLPGNYYLDVWKDIDNSGTWTAGDFVGWYGSGGLGSPALTEFQIVQGETKNFNVQMYIIAKGDKLPK